MFAKCRYMDSNTKCHIKMWSFYSNTLSNAAHTSLVLCLLWMPQLCYIWMWQSCGIQRVNSSSSLWKVYELLEVVGGDKYNNVTCARFCIKHCYSAIKHCRTELSIPLWKLSLVRCWVTFWFLSNQFVRKMLACFFYAALKLNELICKRKVMTLDRSKSRIL